MNRSSSKDSPDLSVVIITLNEEKRLPICLQSLPRGAEIVLLDSGSTDRTVEIATRAGARVETRPFTDYAEQKNAAIGLASRNWILSIDADEVLDERLRISILEATSPDAGTRESGFRLRRHLIFMGRRMRFGRTSDRPLRLFRKGRGRFVSPIHEKFVLESGSTGHLAGRMAHDSYTGITDYFHRFNLYTSRVADNHIDRRGRTRPGPLHVLRPWGEFLKRYVLLLGFLDGYPGYCYALFSSSYAFVKYVKIRERCLEQPARPQRRDM